MQQSLWKADSHLASPGLRHFTTDGQSVRLGVEPPPGLRTVI